MSEPPTETLVTFLLDRTGSMELIRDDTIGAFNTYLGELQTEPAGIIFTLLQFDSLGVDVNCRNKAVAEVAKLTRDTFVPRGWTPLIDAAYKTIRAVERAVAERVAEPKVVICIQTDGEENASKEHTWEQLNALIKEKIALGWEFNFMGAGIDAYDQGRRMGIGAANTVSYDSHSPAATQAAFGSLGANTRSFASGLSASNAFSGAQKRASGDQYDPGPVPADPLQDRVSLVDEIDLGEGDAHAADHH